MIGGVHLSPKAVVDLLDGHGTDRTRRHVETCMPCRTRVDDVRTAMTMAAAVDVPEPSPLFWDHLSDRVGRAISDEPEPQASGWWPAWGRSMSVTAVLALLVLAIIVVRRPQLGGTGVTRTAPAATTAAVTEDTNAPADRDMDEGAWAVVTALSAELADDANESAALEPAPGMAERVVQELSVEEQGELVRLLEAELARRPS